MEGGKEGRREGRGDRQGECILHAPKMSKVLSEVPTLLV